MKVKVRVYDGSKYTAPKSVKEVEYEINGFEVKQISDKDIRSMGFDEVDPCGEYLILKFQDGDTSTFRNSFCDMFRI